MQLLMPGHALGQETGMGAGAVIYDKQDSVIVENILSGFDGEQDKSTGELLSAIGKKFPEKPYVGQTLENGVEEKLVINLREFDCTTFAENCLALARTIKSDKHDFAQFASELEKIRYRHGKRAGYPSRLHYFSDWIHDNVQKGLVTAPTTINDSPLHVKVNFMSAHPDSYPVLKDYPDLVPVIAKQEEVISGRDYFYLKKENVRSHEDQLQEGDIIGLVTSIPGLDVAHVGILIKQDGHIYMMHASSALEKVVISIEPLSDLLMQKKSYTGIMVARPK